MLVQVQTWLKSLAYFTWESMTVYHFGEGRFEADDNYVLEGAAQMQQGKACATQVITND